MSNKSLGAAIARIRKNGKIRQEEFAKRIEVTQPYLSQVESGKKEASLSLLKKISKELDVPVGFIHLISITENDVPEHNKHAWTMLNPAIKTLMVSVFPEKLKGV